MAAGENRYSSSVNGPPETSGELGRPGESVQDRGDSDLGEIGEVQDEVESDDDEDEPSSTDDGWF